MLPTAHLTGIWLMVGQHETKKIQTKLDRATAQLTRLNNDATLLSRPQGLVLLNPISGGRTHPVAVSDVPVLHGK